MESGENLICDENDEKKVKVTNPKKFIIVRSYENNNPIKCSYLKKQMQLLTIGNN